MPKYNLFENRKFLQFTEQNNILYVPYMYGPFAGSFTLTLLLLNIEPISLHLLARLLRNTFHIRKNKSAFKIFVQNLEVSIIQKHAQYLPHPLSSYIKQSSPQHLFRYLSLLLLYILEAFVVLILCYIYFVCGTQATKSIIQRAAKYGISAYTINL